MPQHDLPAPLQRFVDAVNRLLETESEESCLHPRVGDAMGELVARDDWLDPAFAQPHPQYYQQYLLYADPADRFSVVSFVWGPGQETPIHDHTVWGVVGMLRGEERAQNYEIDAGGRPIPVGAEMTLKPGGVVSVSPAIENKGHPNFNCQYDPVKIHHWVRNHIEWIPTWGAVQNAELTLSAERGNAMDIASLTLALLRASGIPSRYVHGTIELPTARFNNWAGGFEDSFAAADYAASEDSFAAADYAASEDSFAAACE